VLSLDGTLVVQLINFVVFLAILNVVFMKPVGAAIARRRAYIDGLKHDFEQLQHDEQELRKRAESRRIAARREADETVAKERVGAAQEADKIVAAAQGRATEITAEAHAEVQKEVSAARADEGRVVDALAGDMVARALGGVA
jgi:F-type H+-transporting ATPase subunit b